MGKQVDEKRRDELKQKAMVYMPRDLGSIQSHKQILKMVADVIPAVKVCIEQTDMQLWPKVESGEMPLKQAIAQCAYQADQAISTAYLADVKFVGFSEEMLLRAWISLEYYAFVLKDAYSINVRNAQADITAILLQEHKPGQPGTNAVTYDDDKTVWNPQKIPAGVSEAKPAKAHDNSGAKPATPVKPVQPVAPTQPVAPAKAVAPAKPVTPVQPEKPVAPAKKSKAGLLIAVSAVAVVGALLLAGPLFGKTQQAERAINSIGTVTLESENAILAAEAKVAELSEDQISKVDNYNVLEEARSEFDRLKTQEAIELIGKVTMESESAIAHAEELYDALPRLARGKVENYTVLSNARKELVRLQTAVSDAKTAIAAIGTVSLESADAIRTAREAYNALLADDLEAYVSDQLPVLVEAETVYAQYASDDLYNTGYALYEKGSYEEAIAKFDALITSYPDFEAADWAKSVKAECQVALARKASQSNDNYTAMKLLNSVEEAHRGTKEYQDLLKSIQTKLKNTRPTTGLSIDGTAGWGQCYFEITAPETDVCVKIKEFWEGEPYKMVYIRAGETTKIYIEDGMYSVYWATGEYWFGKDRLFGDDTQYMHAGGTSTFKTTYEGSWIYYYYSQIDLGDDSRSQNVIQPDEF